MGCSVGPFYTLNDHLCVSSIGKAELMAAGEGLIWNDGAGYTPSIDFSALASLYTVNMLAHSQCAFDILNTRWYFSVVSLGGCVRDQFCRK